LVKTTKFRDANIEFHILQISISSKNKKQYTSTGLSIAKIKGIINFRMVTNFYGRLIEGFILYTASKIPPAIFCLATACITPCDFSIIQKSNTLSEMPTFENEIIGIYDLGATMERPKAPSEAWRREAPECTVALPQYGGLGLCPQKTFEI